MFELVKLIVGLFTLFFVVKTIKTSTNRFIVFVVFALWLRFFLSAFHSITYDPIIAGFSLNALGSIGVTALGLYLIPKNFFALKKLIPVYLFLSAVVLSAFYNAEYSGLIKALVKWAYFLTLALGLFLAYRISGVRDTTKRAIIPFMMPFLLQLFSVLLGEVKASEADGSASYIGGYNHEAAFSMILVAFVMLVGLLPRKTIQWQTTVFVLGVIFIFLANYRTALLAVLPVIAIFIYASVNPRISSRYKLPVTLIFSVSVVLLLAVFFTAQQERFQDISTFFTHLDSYFKAPEFFSRDERRVFSARVYIWSQYLTVFFNADLWHQLVGFGPESWNGVFKLYAHNTFVSYLYEFGYIGCAFFVFFNLYLLVHAWKMNDKSLSKIVFFSLVGFLVMNLATMPIWNIEGLIVYAILVSLIFANPKLESRTV